MMSFCFSYVSIITVPAASFVDDFRSLRTIKAVFVRKEGFDAACVLKDDKWKYQILKIEDLASKSWIFKIY